MTSSSDEPEEPVSSWQRAKSLLRGYGERFWRSYWRVVIAWFGTAVLLIAVVSQLMPAPTQEAEPTAEASSAVVVGIPGLRWSDIDAEETPKLWQLAKDGALGSLSVETAGTANCPLDGWLTLSAGAPASGNVPLHNQRCPDVSDTAITQHGNDGAAIVGDQEYLVRYNHNDFQGVAVGTLPSAVRCATAVGPGASYAGARPTGKLDNYETDLPETSAQWRDVLGECALSIIDLGALPPDTQEREAAVAHADAVVGDITSVLDDDVLLLVAGVSDTSPSPQLHAVIAVGGGFGAGWLTSPGSKRQDNIRVIDLAPTIVSSLDRPVPKPMVGTPLTTLDRSETMPQASAQLTDTAAKATAQVDASPKLVWIVTVTSLAFLIYAAFILQRMRRGPGPARRWTPPTWAVRGLVLTATALSLVLMSTMAVDVIPWWRASQPLLALLGSCALVVAAVGAVVLRWSTRHDPKGIAFAVALVGIAVAVWDVLDVANFQFGGVATYNLVSSAESAGMRPLGFAVFAASLMLGAGCVAQMLNRAYRPICFVVAGALGVYVVGVSYLGDDPVQAVALTVATCLSAGLATGGWLTFARLAWAGFAGFGLVVVMAITDAARPGSDGETLGGLFSELLGGYGGNRVRLVLESDVVSIMMSPLTLLLCAAVIFTWLVLLRPAGGLNRAFGLYPSVRAGFIGAAVAVSLAGMFSGNGFVTAGAALSILMPLAVVMALRSLSRDRRIGRRSKPRSRVAASQ